MKRFRLPLLAIGSAAVAIASTDAARPRYGGTLRLQEAGVLRSLDPAADTADGDERSARAHLLPLVFETLVAVDPAGGLRPLVAATWEREARGNTWRFHVRPHVMLHDGSVLEPWHIASALRASHTTWTVTIDGDTVAIDPGQPRADLPWELAEARYAIGVRSRSGEWIGSGPFRVDRVEPRRVTLRAHDNYWNGRPFLDAVQLEMGRSVAEQLTNLELGRADIVSVRPTDMRRIAQRGLRTAASQPLDLFVLVFEPHRTRSADDPVRRAIASSIDRAVLCAALLQRQAEPATALLPRWLSGYALRVAGQRPLRSAITAIPLQLRTLTLRIDPSDPLAQSIADRIAVDARELGVVITVQAPAGLAPRPDARLVRLKLPATTPDRALAAAMAGLGPRLTALATSESAPPAGAPIELVYRIERALVDRDVIVPVVHVSDVYVVADGVESWNGRFVQRSGAWDLANVWLQRGSPAQR